MCNQIKEIYIYTLPVIQRLLTCDGLMLPPLFRQMFQPFHWNEEDIEEDVTYLSRTRT